MFKDIDNTDAVLGRLRGLAGRRAVAGIFSPSREAQAEKLGYQEFGTPTVPQRQTVAPSFDQNDDKLVRDAAADINAVVDDALAPAAVAENAAKTMAANIRERIESNTPPPLAKSTLATRRRRGNTSSQTLVDTRDMLKAIEHDVWEGEGGGG